MLWSQLSAALQTPTSEKVELAMQLTEEGKYVTKIQLQAAHYTIDTNIRVRQICFCDEVLSHEDICVHSKCTSQAIGVAFSR